MPRRIKVDTTPVADHYVQQDIERVVEFSDPATQLGGLISFRRTPEGELLVSLYRLDKGVAVTVEEGHLGALVSGTQRPASIAATRRSRRLALSLLELGESRQEAEKQLLRWRYEPEVAADAVVWASERLVTA